MKSLCTKMIRLGFVVILLSGCASTSTENEDSMKTDATRTKVEGVATGTIIGAGVGAVLGAVLGGEDGAKLGAAIGGIVGLTGGAIVGNSVAEKKQKYVETEESLDSTIKLAVDSNTQLRDYNARTEKRIVDLNREISRLKSHNQSYKARFSQLQQKQHEIRASVNEAEQQKSNKEKELSALNEYLAGVDFAQQQTKADQLQKEIDELKTNIAMLDSNNKQMAQMADSLTVRK